MSTGRVVVVGAGITGLTAAWWLSRAGVDVVVLEAGSAVGGTMQTIHDDGWLIETGPNSALETTPLFGEMFNELGIAAERLYANASADKRYILREGGLHALPMSPGSFLGTRLWSGKAKLRLLLEPLIGRAEREESIAEFVERRLGREFLDYAINPFVAGVYAGNPSELSVQAAFPKLYALEEKYGGLIKGMIRGRKERKQRQEKAKDRARLFSFAMGMQTFPDAIARHLRDRIRLGTSITSFEKITPDGKLSVRYLHGEKEERLDGDAIVLAVPAYVAASLVSPLSATLSDALKSIYYPPVAEVFLGFREEQVPSTLDGFGYLIPEKEGRKVLGTIWSSSLFPNRAPDGHVALTTFVGGARQPEIARLGDDELVALVTEEVRSLMGVEGKPVYSRVIKWERAIPQYRLGYSVLMDQIRQFESAHPGVFLLGNYRGGIAVGDCVMSGAAAASGITEFLKNEHQREPSQA